MRPRRRKREEPLTAETTNTWRACIIRTVPDRGDCEAYDRHVYRSWSGGAQLDRQASRDQIECAVAPTEIAAGHHDVPLRLEAHLCPFAQPRPQRELHGNRAPPVGPLAIVRANASRRRRRSMAASSDRRLIRTRPCFAWLDDHDFRSRESRRVQIDDSNELPSTAVGWQRGRSVPVGPLRATVFIPVGIVSRTPTSERRSAHHRPPTSCRSGSGVC